MLRFWLDALGRAVMDTFAAIGKDPADLRFSILVVGLMSLAIVSNDGLKNGWPKITKRIGSLFEKNVKYILILVGLTLAYYIAKEPYLMWQAENGSYTNQQAQTKAVGEKLSECSANLKSEQTKSGLLSSQVASQQGIINGQQATFNGQQAVFSKCMLTLTEKNAPKQSIVASVVWMDEYAQSGTHVAELIVRASLPIQEPIRMEFDFDQEILETPPPRVEITGVASGLFGATATVTGKTVITTIGNNLSPNQFFVLFVHSRKKIGKGGFKLLS